MAKKFEFINNNSDVYVVGNSQLAGFQGISKGRYKFKSLFLSESGLSGQNMVLRGWSLVFNLFNVRPVSVQVLKEQKMPV